MRAQDLRIGNWVNSQFGGIQQVVDVMCDGVNTLKYEGINYEFIDPIPLTEEWLLKFGFEPNIYNDEFELYPLTFDCEYTDEGNWNISYDSYPLSTEIKHVHQLQNLYFALTGEELTIKNEQR